MTRVQAYSRNQQAREVINAIIRKALRAPAPVQWSVAARNNHSGEPALYVYVEMPSEKDIPSIPDRNRLTGKMLSELEKIDDDRFPYLSFGPWEGEEGGEETAYDSHEG